MSCLLMCSACLVCSTLLRKFSNDVWCFVGVASVSYTGNPAERLKAAGRYIKRHVDQKASLADAQTKKNRNAVLDLVKVSHIRQGEIL